MARELMSIVFCIRRHSATNELRLQSSYIVLHEPRGLCHTLELTARLHPRPIRLYVRARQAGREERRRRSQLGLRRRRRPMLEEGHVSLEEATPNVK